MPNDKKPWEDYIASKKEAEKREAPKPKPSLLDRGSSFMRGLMGSSNVEREALGDSGNATDPEEIIKRRKKINAMASVASGNKAAQ